MSLKAPVAGERKILAASHGRVLYERPFTYPDGRVESYSIWGWQKGSPSLIFPVTADGYVIAIRQFRHGANDFIIELPGGMPKKDEDPQQAAATELMEETGYCSGRFIPLGATTWIDAPSNDVRVNFFLALDCTKVAEISLDDNEVLEMIRVPLQEWYQWIADGIIIDAKVIAHSMLALPFLAKVTFD
jgi:ADP-ribose pyrophosphatase